MFYSNGRGHGKSSSVFSGGRHNFSELTVDTRGLCENTITEIRMCEMLMADGFPLIIEAVYKILEQVQDDSDFILCTAPLCDRECFRIIEGQSLYHAEPVLRRQSP